MCGMVRPQRSKKRKLRAENYYHLEPYAILKSMIFLFNKRFVESVHFGYIRKGPVKTVAYSSGTVKRLRALPLVGLQICPARLRGAKFGLKPTLARNRERGRIRVATAAEPWEGAEEEILSQEAQLAISLQLGSPRGVPELAHAAWAGGCSMASHLLEKVAQDGTNSLRERVYRHLEAALREGQLHHGTCLDRSHHAGSSASAAPRCATRSSGWSRGLRDHPAPQGRIHHARFGCLCQKRLSDIRRA